MRGAPGAGPPHAGALAAGAVLGLRALLGLLSLLGHLSLIAHLGLLARVVECFEKGCGGIRPKPPLSTRDLM